MTAVNLNRAIRGPVTAVPVVAGKGVRLVADTVNNRYVVEADETVLFENSTTGGSGAHSVTLSESLYNFEFARFVVCDDAKHYGVIYMDMTVSPTNGTCAVYWADGFRALTVSTSNGITWSIDGKQNWGGGGGTIGSTVLSINKVTGINRVSST